MYKSIVLIIGFGSIGQRHYRNLFGLDYREIYVYDVAPVRKSKYPSIKILKELSIGALEKFDIVFICSPNNLHIKHANLVAEAGCHLFIEKPLSHNLKSVDRLNKLCAQKKLIDMIACNMRFHPCLKFIKKYLDKGGLGKIYSINHEFGYYLPYWRPGQDYRNNYAAKADTGGGIIFDDIHEFDLLFWLNDFIDIDEHKYIFNKISNLEIETEDICLSVFKFKNGVLGSVKCDYLQQKYTRTCKVVGEKGSLEWDFNENVIWLHTKDKSKKLFEVNNYDINMMYIDEVKYFLNCVNKQQKTFNNIKTASKVLKYCVQRK